MVWLNGYDWTRELFFLRKTKSLMSTYPHILNLFFFVDLNVIDKNNRKLIDMALLGSERELKSVKSNAIVIFIMRVAMSTAIFLFMMVPFYYGAFSFVMSSSPFIQGIVFMCLLVNAIQVLIFIYNEFCFHNDTFIHYPREV